MGQNEVLSKRHMPSIAVTKVFRAVIIPPQPTSTTDRCYCMTVESNIAAGGLAVLLLGMALYGRQKWHAATLATPCVWVAISAICLAALALMQTGDADTLEMSVLRFAVAASTLTPLVAVLGAKRPQDRGWQWVVLTLWLIVVWPALQAFANPAGSRVELFAAWKLFLFGLVAMGPLNYLATRHWFASLLVATGQLIVLGEFLGFGTNAAWRLPTAVGCFFTASLLVALRKTASASINTPLAEQSARWLRFRDSFGAFWGLRIMQRVNETAALRDWPVQLAWSGFEDVPPVAGLSEAGSMTQKSKPRSQTSATANDEIEQSLDTLLRRFF